MKPRLQERYEKEVRSALAEKFGYENANAVPRLLKKIRETKDVE